MSETDCQVTLVRTTCFHKKMVGFVLCGVSVACNSLKTMATDKLFQRIFVNLHTEFIFARSQTTLFVEHYLLNYL